MRSPRRFPTYRCISICPSRSRRTRPASRRTAGRRRRCSTRPGSSAAGRARCMRRTCTDVDVRAARQLGDVLVLLPDHRAGPRRRDRAVGGAARRRVAVDARVGQSRGDRPVRGDARGGAERAARLPGARPLVGVGAVATRQRSTAIGRSASTTPGSIEVGARADLVAVRLDSVRTAGTGGTVETAVFAASAADVSDVVVSGKHLVADGKHVNLMWRPSWRPRSRR